MVRILESKNFDKEIQEEIILVDFYASWCPPCKMLTPVLEEVASSRKYVVGKINIDENIEIAKKYNVESVPTLIVFKNGKEVDKEVGYMEKNQVIELLDRNI